MLSDIRYQPYRSPEGWYSLIYPDTWECEVIEGIPAFYDPQNGVGALQVSAFVNRTGNYDIEEELIRFLNFHHIDYDENSIASFKNNQGSEIRACEFISEHRFWLSYLIANGAKLILCTYNSDESPDAELSEILRNIISSIQFLRQE